MEPMQPMKPMEPMQPMKPMSDAPADCWWPQSLGSSPDSSGGQNEVRYAYFGDRHRLAVDAGDGKVKVYDTAGRHIGGVKQAQSGGGGNVVFSGAEGNFSLADLQEVGAGD